MNFKESGFRAFYHNFCAIPMKKALEEAIADFPKSECADYILTYGYVDHELGLTLEVVASAWKAKNGFCFADTNNDISSKIRIDSVEEDEFFYFKDEDGSIAKQFQKKINTLAIYEMSEEIAQFRDMSFIDESRNPQYVDDVLVYLLKDGNRPEGCWVRVEGLGDHFFIGTLLNEPEQNFGYHEGERISFFCQETEDKGIVCVSDMNPSAKLTPEDLAEGTMLEKAIDVFEAERNTENFISVMELLRDSYVWIPCSAKLRTVDMDNIEAMIDEADTDINSLVGKEFTTSDDVRFVPDILQNDGKNYFPVFSNVEAMGEYGNNFSKVQQHFLDAISLARNNEKDISGIIVNAFSVPFVIEKELFDITEKMKSRLVEDENE